MNPDTLTPVVSVRYLPTTPLELARPSGNREDLELRRRRADSQALAASTTTRAFAFFSVPVVLSMYTTPVASPRSLAVISRAIASVRRVRRPVLSAGAIRTSVDEKFDFVMQPRPHCPQ